uniref:TSC22 domain family member 2 n=1 Tax=Salmo trutta TaxID=8032 RepID=A0A673XS46_SALTR
MSKMPAKKKSCFQITSVTQAQVAASSITDDTESLDDPDESRTEDVSSKIFDVSLADPGVCDRSSSEETLNNAGEAEAAVMALHLLQEGQPVAATGGSVPVPTASQPSIPTSTPPVAPSSTTTTSCSSRFRVIKLDHSTGEPFRRGRWTCIEFYERDSEGSSMSRTVDSIKHAVTIDHNADSGLGTTGSNVVAPSALSTQAHESTGDSGYYTFHHGHPPELQQQGYSLEPQTGSGANALQPTGYSATVSQAQVNVHQLDYRQQHLAPLQPQGSSPQTHPMASLSVGPLLSQGPSSVNTPQAGELSGSLHGGPLASTQGLLLQVASGAVMSPALQQPVSHPQPSGGVGRASVVQNVPATVPSATNTPPGMPSQAPDPGGLPLAQVARGEATAGAAGQGLPTASQGDDSRRRSDTLPQPNATPGKDVMRPFIPESLQLATPTVNSLFGIAIPMDGDEDGSSGASVVAIDNKIEQAMDLVKSHLMYAVREEVEVLKEQIKELYERNSQLERENAVLKSLANTDQLTQLSSTQISPAGSTSPPQQQPPTNNANTKPHLEGAAQALSLLQQPNVTSA